jgi:hypothetical protein
VVPLHKTILFKGATRNVEHYRFTLNKSWGTQRKQTYVTYAAVITEDDFSTQFVLQILRGEDNEVFQVAKLSAFMFAVLAVVVKTD